MAKKPEKKPKDTKKTEKPEGKFDFKAFIKKKKK